MRDEKRKEERSKQGQTNNKAKQHSTPEAVTFLKKNELPRVVLEPTTLYTLDMYMYIHTYMYMYMYMCVYKIVAYMHDIVHMCVGMRETETEPAVHVCMHACDGEKERGKASCVCTRVFCDLATAVTLPTQVYFVLIFPGVNLIQVTL